MTYRQIETSREIRQWIRLITPLIGGAIYMDWKYPDLKYKVADRFKSMFKRREKTNEEN